MVRSDAVAAVAGELFEDGWSKIRGAGVSARSQGRRQQQIARAARGHAPAVFKPVRGGGCRTRSQLGNQLTYLTTKSSHIIDSRSQYDGHKTLNDKQISDLVERFAGNWDRATPKLGHTTHMIMSFPIGTRGEDVRDIAGDICENFFMQEGHQFDYIVAVHEDRAHPHAHVLINRRSAEGELFYFGPDHHFNYDDFRMAMVETAERYGVRLEATRRLDRGVHTYKPADKEVYKSKREQRGVQERDRRGSDHARAVADIARTSSLYRALAAEASAENRGDVAKALKQAAELLERGGQLKSDGEIYMAEGQSFEDMTGRFSELAIRAQEMVEQAEPNRRAALERELNDIYAGVAHMQPLGPNSDRLREEPTETGVYSEINIRRGNIGRLSGSDVRGRIEAAVQGTSISADDVVSRLEVGANNAALERQWMSDDLQKIAQGEGLDLDRRDHLERAIERLDSIHVSLGQALKDADIVRDAGVAEDREELTEIGDRAGVTANVLSAMRRDSAIDPFGDATERQAFRDEIEDRLSAEELEDLRAGKENVLGDLSDNRLDRLYAVKAYLQSDETTANSPAVNEIVREIADTEIDTMRERLAETDGEKGETHG
ncbi:hypothetical protein D8780_15385 [Notoacmeibacter ruber]|uniref:MobA/VirD2-like nuclease domain-containing protein n=2 Tax=Notoacmeibacter ruber TaxID=2670375 RepID=A0A3L7J3V1_9HYPH|nr:hypothetical protein D8780_15385 [Notoacmeibacter ruber]